LLLFEKEYEVMFRPNWKTLLIGAVLMVSLSTMLVVGSSTADAWWGYHQEVSWGCLPCYAPYTVTCVSDSCCDPCGEWYLGYRPGPIRRALFGSCKWYHSGCGTCCGWGCSACESVDTCCDRADTCCDGDEAAMDGSIEATTEMPTPAMPMTPLTPATPKEAPAAAAEPEETLDAMPPVPPAVTPPVSEPTDTFPVPTTPSPLDAPPTNPLPSSPLTPFGSPPETPLEPPMGMPGVTPPSPEARNLPTPANSGLLTIWVPYDAKVKINGLATKSIGSRRQYVSHGLQPGFSYRYEVHAEVVRDGRVYEDARVVTMTAGERTAVAFGFNISPYEDMAAAR